MNASLYFVANNHPLPSLNPVLFGDLKSTPFAIPPPPPTHMPALWEKHTVLGSVQSFPRSEPAAASRQWSGKTETFSRGQGPNAFLSIWQRSPENGKERDKITCTCSWSDSVSGKPEFRKKTPINSRRLWCSSTLKKKVWKSIVSSKSDYE